MRCELYVVKVDDDDDDDDDSDNDTEGVGYFFVKDAVFKAPTLNYEY
jgi:hypothetical protein